MRSDGGASRRRVLTSTVCVRSSTRGATNVMGLVTSTLPSASSSCTGSPTLRSTDRSSGTWMAASSPSFESIVVITVCDVTRSPWRIGISPIMPACVAVTW